MTDLLRYRAEAIAWPLVCPDSFRHASSLVHQEVLRSSFRLRLQQLGSWREEELIQSVWGEERAVALHLQSHASKLLYDNGSCMRLKPDHEYPGREILTWRWLSLALPPLLLTSAAMPPGVLAPDRIQVLDPTLGPRGPVAHLHLHLGAIYPFELVWSRMASTVRFDEVQDPPIGMHDIEEWRGWLIRALLVRRLLAVHARHQTALAECSLCLSNPDVNRTLGELVAGRQSRQNAFQEARLGRLAREVRFRRQPIQGASDVWYNDPLGGEGVIPETAFMASSFAHLDANQYDHLYAQLWAQYLRVRCILYRQLVADPAEAGLSAFSGRYHRIDQYLGSDFEILAPAFGLDEPELDVKAVEVRSSPPRDAGICHRKVEAIRECLKQFHPVEFGWVVHLIRDLGHANEWPRYAATYRSHNRAAGLLERCIKTWPDHLQVIRGLDLASEELRGPLWLAVPALLKLREISRQSARQRQGLQPLRLTLHVGEDFRHIASGLRAIHEPFAWRLIERGDRLGHALALGIDATKWCQQNPRILQPRLERILDLSWMLDFTLSSGLFVTDGINIHRLQRELGLHVSKWTGMNCRWEYGRELHGLLGMPDTLTRIDYPLMDAPAPLDPPNALWLLWLLLYSRFHQADADEIVEIPTELDAPLLAQIQQRLAELLARWQVTIEVNPSSNLLIGALDHPLDQPMFHLRPVEPHAAHALPIAISADDPITFATRLADEYAYAWAGMVVAGHVSPTYARQWLDDATETAWRSRFTVPLWHDGNPYHQ